MNQSKKKIGIWAGSSLILIWIMSLSGMTWLAFLIIALATLYIFYKKGVNINEASKTTLLICKDCGNEISKNAKVCPKCGAPLPAKTSILTWAVLFSFIVMIIVISISSSREKTPEEIAESTTGISETQAQSYCQIRIKQVVNDPDSVEFDDYQVTLNPDGVNWTVNYNIRAKNAFGGVIRTSYLCTGINDSVQALEK